MCTDFKSKRIFKGEAKLQLDIDLFVDRISAMTGMDPDTYFFGPGKFSFINEKGIQLIL